MCPRAWRLPMQEGQTHGPTMYLITFTREMVATIILWVLQGKGGLCGNKADCCLSRAGSDAQDSEGHRL
jgi:hypothetical protein